ncbi:MAG: hypothetical protein UV20_C0035G0004 [Candidatus Magasanikbacteria bacterium GW2011_GWA2_42_32]|uniref:Uncharacterized protein n=1 Tax=Candidatus Magasanikbacteria bacterium GW2011_GWA2_42_32 TaxID=1619039 RepID=A0A0G1C6M4_9BACT|nr:MAG: hypothetical protein UV20_C0035G0004 [Candidatus Magasanikbacteria bacterium GW2011_GWA2_42_32]
MVVLLLVPEMVRLIDSVRFQTDSERLPSMVMEERVFLAEVERAGKEAVVVKVCSVP